MPSRDKNGNDIFTQAEYEHYVFSGERFFGFVEGMGYVLEETVVVPSPFNRSGTHLMQDICHIQCTVILDSIDQINPDSTQDSSFTEEELRLAVEKSLSYSFNQGKVPWAYREISAFMADNDNFVTNLGYGVANDLFQVAQAVSFGAFEREEWYNPFTGSRYGNLDGTPSYEPMSGFHTAILMGMPIASKKVGYLYT